MKKASLFLAVCMAAMLMTGCRNSSINVGAEAVQESEAQQIEGQQIIVPTTAAKVTETTKFETEAYSIPEGATGPGDVKIEADVEDLPEDKRPESTENVIQVRYFYINSKGLNSEYDIIENGDCDAPALNDLLIRCGVLVDGTEVLSFERNGDDGVLTLNKMEGVSSYATDELLAQAIANAYTDNLFLDRLTIKVGDKTYGPLEYDKGKK